jgi:hypothetical protein
VTENHKEKLDYSHLEVISEMIRHIKYGSITIVIQDGKVIQIDKTEKQRIKN